MSDISDVSNQLVAAAAAVLYPSGTANPSVANTPIRIYPGWPDAATLDADLATGTCHVTVYPLQIERNTSRMPRTWQQVSVNAATLTMTISGQTVTVGGTVSSPQNVMIGASGVDYAYAVQATDTLSSIATALSALILGATSSGAVITLPAAANITAARVGINGTLAMETRRQERVMQLAIWADTPAHRDAIAQPLDQYFGSIERITMPDGFSARLIYRGSPVWDNLQKTGLYRRDLHYAVEYATTTTTGATQITQETINISNNSGQLLSSVTI